VEIQITCPACSGGGNFTSIKSKCTFCGGKSKIPLTHYLKTLIGDNNDVERQRSLDNVLYYQADKTHRAKPDYAYWLRKKNK